MKKPTLPAGLIALATVLTCAVCAVPSALGQTDAALLARNYAVLEESLCPAPDGNTPFPPAYSAVEDPRIAPRQVFDNLYFFGTRVDSTWALTTSEGIVLFDAMFPDEIEETVIDAMPQFGLDPADIKYVVVSHGHADHFGGAALLQERYGAQVVMSNTEWHYLQDTQADGEAPLPERDVTVLDSDTLTLGDTTVRFVTTPGHTPGTISSVFPVRDGEETHLAALWGGTAMNFLSVADVEVYQRSVEKFRSIDPDIEVVLSNHAYADGAELKMAALAERAAGEPHPFVVGNEAFQDWLDVIDGCADAWLELKRESSGREQEAAAAARTLQEPVSTATGLVSGVPGAVEGVLAFKGIPFAAPPVGDLRWQPPARAQSWEGVRSGAQFSAVCVQPQQPDRVPSNVSVDLPDSPPISEDCLYLNVWTPAENAGADLPVMVWIYGGAYTEGAGSTPHNQGDYLAAQDVVVVTFNYRLGALGFLAHPELSAESPHGASGNYALTDAIAALEWVQDNIAAFGGDAGNVTIFGESAGASMAAALVGSPLAAGLFHRAIAQSGTWMGLNLAPMRSRESAEQQTLAAAAKLGAMDLADLRALSAQEVRAHLPAQGMIIDGWVVPEDLSITFAEGRQNAVDVLVGSNRDEGSFTAGFGPPMTADLWRESAGQRWGDLAQLGLAAYPARTDEEAAAYGSKSFTDNMAWSMRLFAEKQRALGKRAYVYHFVHEPPYPQGARDIGVCHACEIPYVFNNLGTPRVIPDVSSPQLALASKDDIKVADITSSYWTNFARSGDPNGEGLARWPLFEDIESGPVLHIDATPHVGDSLGADKTRLYDALYSKID